MYAHSNQIMNSHDSKRFLSHLFRTSDIYPGIEYLILPMLSYPGRQVTSSCEIASKRIQGLLEAYFKINK